jgi:ELWxxDGT repeat protein
MIGLGDTVLFQAGSGSGGMQSNRELWKSDGTEAGTMQVKDINVGTYGSTPTYFTLMGETVFFAANAGPGSNSELWKTDGTETGTVLVKEINPANSIGGRMYDLTVVGDTMFFVADDGTHGSELWKSDGTTNGTMMVKDVGPGGMSADEDGVVEVVPSGYGVNTDRIVAAGDKVFFVGNDGLFANHPLSAGHGHELWVSDGTANGTFMLKDINPGNHSSSGSMYNLANSSFNDFHCFTAVGDILFFCADDGINGKELWKTDGTANGTVMVKDINPGNADGIPGYANFKGFVHFAAVGDTLFFVAWTQANGLTLWKSDGTEAGTVEVKDIYAGTSTSCGLPSWRSCWTDMFQAFGDDLIFQANDHSGNGYALWKSDGTAAGTVMVKDILPGAAATNPVITMTHPMVFGNMLYFAGDDGTNGEELWQSDGTANGTVLAYDLFTGTYSGTPNAGWPTSMTGVGTKLYFLGCQGGPGRDAVGCELHALDPANITLDLPPPVSWETHPALPAGMSISGGTISGTPSVYANNQTYTIYANQSGYSTTHELYFSVDTDNAHTVVENQTIDAIGFHPPFNNGTTCWTVSPALPGNLSMDTSTGEITGSVNGTLTNTTYTVTANHGCSGSGSGGSSGNGTTYVPGTPPQMSQQARVGDHFMLEHDGIIYYDAILESAYTAWQHLPNRCFCV